MTTSEHLSNTAMLVDALDDLDEWAPKSEESLKSRLTNAADQLMAEMEQVDAEYTYRLLVGHQREIPASGIVLVCQQRICARAHATLVEANWRAQKLGLPPRDVADIAQAGSSSSRGRREVVIKREESNVIDDQRAKKLDSHQSAQQHSPNTRQRGPCGPR